MTIQFNTDRKVNGNQTATGPLIALITDELSRFSHQITRVEAYLSDVNGDKNSANDKRCVLEARPEGMKAVVVTNLGNTHAQAVEGAVEKLKSSLEKTLGRLKDH